MITIFQNNILNWWSKNKRYFLWRETNDPYKILCAEILLQQTNAEKVVPVYNKITAEYPDIKALSESDRTVLKEFIRPLGLLKRADRLKEIAGVVINQFDGVIPESRKKLLELPGVGDYTANALISFAYGKNAGVLDTNTIRILARVFDLKSNKARPRNDKNLQSELNNIIPKNKSRDFNYALLDFAALICTAAVPDCSSCVVNTICINPVNI